MSQITIGRNAQSNIVVDATYNTVSGNHATISFDGNAYTLQDHSTNGTYINGNRIHNATCQIRKGDHITLGSQYVLNMNEVISLLGGGQATQRRVHQATSPMPQVAPQVVQQAPEKQESVRQPMPNSYMGLAIVSLILGISFPICWILSIIAIVNAGKVSTSWSNKEYSTAREASNKAKTLSWISIVLGFVFVIVNIAAFMSM